MINQTTIEPLYEKMYDCPFCQSSFKTKKMRSRFAKVERADTDLGTFYKNEACNPLLYTVNVCPTCGYAFTDHFSTHLTPASKELIKNKITLKWKHRNYGNERSIQNGLVCYKLALLSASLKNEKSLIIAGLCMRIAWIYRELNNWEQESRFIANALTKYEQAYQQFEIFDTSMSEVKIQYLIGELHRRLGSEEKALPYFENVLKYQNKTAERTIIELAKQQKFSIEKEIVIA